MNQPTTAPPIGVLKVPFNSDGTRPETENPPSDLAESGLFYRLNNTQLLAKDAGEVAIPVFDGIRDSETGILNLNAWQEISRALAERLPGLFDSHREALVLGGDCSILVGVFGALKALRGECGLLMLDGHTDFRQPHDSPTGEAADMELAVLTGHGPSAMTALFGAAPLLREEDTRVLGVHSLDQIDRSEIQYARVSETHQIGVEKQYDKIVAPLVARKVPLWVHFDVDCIRRSEMAAVAFPSDDGLSFEQVVYLLKRVRSETEVLGMTACCYRPSMDPIGNDAERLIGALAEVLAAG